MTPETLQFYVSVGIVWLAAWTSFGVWIAAQKRRSLIEGAVVCAIFGPVGAIVEACLPVRSEEDIEAERAAEEEDATEREADKQRSARERYEAKIARQRRARGNRSSLLDE
jgi:hypothetical protein